VWGFIRGVLASPDDAVPLKDQLEARTYIRRDLLAEYAGARNLVQLAWGERQVDDDWGNPPDWLNDARSEHADLWRQVAIVALE
jgi:hypothetical protein